MKIEIQIEDSIYKDVINFLNLLPPDKVKIMDITGSFLGVNLNKYVGKIKNLPVDPLQFQSDIRNEWR